MFPGDARIYLPKPLLITDQYAEEFTQLWNNLGRHPLPTPALELLSHLKQGFFHLSRVHPCFHLLITPSLEKSPAWSMCAEVCGVSSPVSFPFPTSLFTTTPSLLLGWTRGISCPHVPPALLPHRSVCCLTPDAAGCPCTDSPAPQHR